MAAPATRPVSLMDRVLCLGQAVKQAAGRSPAPALARARQVVAQVDRRLAFSGDHTVIALAGATGSGKSSLFNALAGQPLAATGVKRPTTAQAVAAAWGPAAPDGLLDWLQVRERHIVAGGDPRLSGLVLLDLPDHDSTQDSHRVEVDRLVGLVDGMVWVLDPQKYADRAIHERYLRPYADYAEVMVVVLNQADQLRPAAAKEAGEDLRRLLAAEGLGAVPVLSTSALTGEGLDALRAELARLVKDKQTAAARLSYDISAAAAGLAGELTRHRNRSVSPAHAAGLETALGAAAGVPEVVEAVRQATQLRGQAATGWPVTSWVNRLKPDPLKLLHLDRLGVPALAAASRGPDEDEQAAAAIQRTALRVHSGVRKARVDQAVRALSDDVSAGLPAGWAASVRQASLAQEAVLADQLDAAVAATDLGAQRPRAWWTAVRAVQWGLLAVVGVGLLWLLSAPLLRALGIPALPALRWHAVPAATWLILGGLLGGLLVGLASRWLVALSARHQAARAQAALSQAVAEVAQRCVVGPVNAELQRYAAFVAALARAL